MNKETKNNIAWLDRPVTKAFPLFSREKLILAVIIILALLSSGKTKAEIANELGISRETVKVHTRNVYAALDVHAQDELTTLVATEQRALEERIE